MKYKELKEQYVGKKLLTIISLDLTDDFIKESLKKMTPDSSYSELENAKLLIFEDKMALIFIDYDCDRYRSGEWYLLAVKDILDKGYTKDIKAINSIVRNIEFFTKSNLVEYTSSNDDEGVIMTTDKYIIKMGQSNVSDYYPCNFFNIEECKDYALGDAEIIDFSEETSHAN